MAFLLGPTEPDDHATHETSHSLDRYCNMLISLLARIDTHLSRNVYHVRRYWLQQKGGGGTSRPALTPQGKATGCNGETMIPILMIGAQHSKHDRSLRLGRNCSPTRKPSQKWQWAWARGGVFIRVGLGRNSDEGSKGLAVMQAVPRPLTPFPTPSLKDQIHSQGLAQPCHSGHENRERGMRSSSACREGRAGASHREPCEKGSTTSGGAAVESARARVNNRILWREGFGGGDHTS